MPTPAEKMGYQVGDLFRVNPADYYLDVLCGDQLWELLNDDCSYNPYFGLLTGRTEEDPWVPDDVREGYLHTRYITLAKLSKVCGTHEDTEHYIKLWKMCCLLGIQDEV